MDIQTVHEHTYEVTGEYKSKGKNLFGKTVQCVMENVKCTDCKVEDIRRKHES